MPVVPDLAAKLMKMLEKGQDFSFAEMEQVISGDPGLTVKVLKVANSALYSRPRAVTQLSTAISFLGFDTIRSLVVLVVGASLFEKDRRQPFFQGFWRQSLNTAFHAKGLAVLAALPNLDEEAFTAGLLHNIGQAALYYTDTVGYESLRTSVGTAGRLEVLEHKRFGTNHKEVGAQVLDSWNFPELYIEVARQHGNPPGPSIHAKTVALVTVAGFLASNLRLGTRSLPLDLVAGDLALLKLDLAAVAAWAKTFVGTMEELPLYRECRTLFLP